jgi:Carboxypeptidase regulatory-like domain
MRATRLTSIFTALTAAVVLALAGAAVAADTITISGSVTNATTGKPAAGVSVTLVDPLGGMAEVATAKSDAQGHFTFNAPPARGPRLVRAGREGVNYFQMIPPGTTTAALSVYDAAPKVEGISGTADVLRLQAEGGTLQALEMFVIGNNSQPPRALASPTTFDFVLPAGAQIDETDAQAPNGQPISVEAKPAGKNRYAFSFALKPGETRFQVSYHLPYSGQASFSPLLTRDYQHFVVVTPTGMTFTPKDSKLYQSMDAQQPGANVQVSMQTRAGENLAYSVSGTGTYPEQSDSGSASASAPSANGREDNRPGGGLGVPIDAPDGLAKYQWYILTALMAILIGGGIWTHERSRVEAAALAGVAPSDASPAVDAPVRQRTASPADAAPAPQPAPGNMLLAALKEEIFALEVDHQQGKLSQAEYEKARAALEQTLQRALTRTKS